MANTITSQKIALHVPLLEEVATVLQEGLSKNFADVKVSVVDCPDLSQEPYMLADIGLCGSPRLADVGGVPHLFPVPQKDKIYNMDKIADLAELPNSFMVGAGAGPAEVVGRLCELVPNIKVGKHEVNKTHICKINPEDGQYIVSKLNSKEFNLMVNLFLSEGKPGKVLEVKARQRTGPENFMSCLRHILAKRYQTKPVGLGGVFVIEEGKAKLHVMPGYPTKPIESAESADNWLKFFEMSAPLVCLGYLVSHDPGADLRIEHFHCFSKHGDGGHYHEDTTPNTASYRAYFNLAEYLYRIDQPTEPHAFEYDK